MARTRTRLKLTPERQAGIVEQVAQGVPMATAARNHGITETTFWRWMKAGEQPRGSSGALYRGFRESVYAAVSRAESSAVQAIHKAWTGDYIVTEEELKDGRIRRTYGKPDWSAAAWYLERRHRDQWGKVDVVNVRMLAEHVAEQEGLTPAEREELERELAAILGTK